MALLDKVAGEVEKEYGTLAVKWGDVMRFRRGNADVPGNGAPSSLGAIRTINVGPFVNGKTEAVSGDTFYAVIEFSTPQRGEALLGYGNWSKPGSKHVEDQLPLLSRKEMRPIWRGAQGHRGESGRPEGVLSRCGQVRAVHQVAHRCGCTRCPRVPLTVDREPCHREDAKQVPRSRSRRGASGPRLRARIVRPAETGASARLRHSRGAIGTTCRRGGVIGTADRPRAR